RINPCGLFGMEVTQIADFVEVPINQVQQRLIDVLLEEYGLRISHSKGNP
ncbi:MAG: lipoate-protein ligase B, partial [Candidatus Azotimanducaceae bacterium]